MIKMAKSSVIESSKEILGGEIIFKGTRVPVRTLIHYIQANNSLSDFLGDFPTVTKRQAVDFLNCLLN